jgi:hypothetical protein
MSLSDPALFYETSSHISRDITASFSGYVKENQGLTLHSQALGSVNKRLSDPIESISDGIIATILGFACFSVSCLLSSRDRYANEMHHSDGDWASYNMHMEGLPTIIRLKGGLHALDHNRILRLLLSGYD